MGLTTESNSADALVPDKMGKGPDLGFVLCPVRPGCAPIGCFPVRRKISS